MDTTLHQSCCCTIISDMILNFYFVHMFLAVVVLYLIIKHSISSRRGQPILQSQAEKLIKSVPADYSWWVSWWPSVCTTGKSHIWHSTEAALTCTYCCKPLCNPHTPQSMLCLTLLLLSRLLCSVWMFCFCSPSLWLSLYECERAGRSQNSW